MVSGLLEAKEEAKDEKVTMSGKYECGPKTVGQSKAQKGNKSKRNQMMTLPLDNGAQFNINNDDPSKFSFSCSDLSREQEMPMARELKKEVAGEEGNSLEGMLELAREIYFAVRKENNM